jgi:hypothetical protein
MCEWGDTCDVLVKIPEDLSCEGREKWKTCKIDRCIAPIVRALQEGGVDMRGSCCGHGKGPGHIGLQDGRGLLILSVEGNKKYLTEVLRDGRLELVRRQLYHALKEVYHRVRDLAGYLWWTDCPSTGEGGDGCAVCVEADMKICRGGWVERWRAFMMERSR